MYDLGTGIKSNKYEAVRWYKKASDKGHARAMYFLGFNYMVGEGVEINSYNRLHGISLIKKAAQLVCKEAQSDLLSKGIRW